MAQLSLNGDPLLAEEGTVASIEAVLFDKDGTLSLSEPMLHGLASARLAQCIRLFQGATPDADRHCRLGDLLRRIYGLSEIGINPEGVTAVASRDHNLIATATALVSVGLGWPEALAMSEQTFALTDGLHGQLSLHPPQPTEGLERLLLRLNDAGLRCAVISNDHAEGIQAFIEAHTLDHHFQAIWSAAHRPCKPDPEAVHALCHQLGVPAHRCALIGDANSDLAMARSAGVAVVLGYGSGWRQPPPLDPTFPRLHHWDELDVLAC